MEIQATNSPFNQEQSDWLNRLLPTLSDYQRIWLSGYLSAAQSAALVSAGSALTIAEAPQAVGQAQAQALAPVAKDVTILFGSQTGNSDKLAKKMAKRLEGEGFEVTTASMNNFKANNLKKISHLLIVVSTHGEGEPPDNAISFHEFIHSKRAPQLEGMHYSILALGDTSYEFFCQTGKDFDKRLEELGATRIADRADCDVDFEETASEWMSQVSGALAKLVQAQSGAAAQAAGGASIQAAPAALESEYSRSNPFQAEVLENLNLNGRGSDRETRHVEISLEGSDLTYEPGDSIGIVPENDSRLVDELIAYMGWQQNDNVIVNKNGEQHTLRNALISYYEITVLTKPLLKQFAETTSNAELTELVGEGQEQKLKSYLSGRDLIDLVKDYSLKGMSAQTFVSLLRKIPARLYSISSSLKANPEEVHITVRSVRYEANGRERNGVCSVQLAERVAAGDKLPIFIQNNPNFKLPESTDTPIIMIGPGTGVAPFRAFLGEREEAGAEGKSWLFYGDQHFATDFLYQVEWQRWLKDGVLTRMDVAFSRDTAEKVYVQHRMLEKGEELYKWLQEGAHVYVCGDEKRMAHDVHAALLEIIGRHGGLSAEQAAEYVAQMQQQKRYQRDVY
ncbi:assimilatory sulfite reductase (NADPH) flavoprotein subunit [Paenibacillus harenae]|uniref:assimilatory sulfite reductase (NADPH) flavoprotein subunit n=1 Tax=Paenibacillus harenae TaxID=306543 RepID=UPI002792B303|nr:assimilatory sulfite reductase (NADPH) flavoprotein subunit [Paenibacillus harenae]MDQ0059856.1 sulfite reductase (NADPH) flavoprotein alpha-component [Paenibacillus harenae]